MIDLSLSIVNTNNWVYLEPCIKAIIDTTHNIAYEILVVDNASSDGSVEKIRENFPEVILSVNEKRYGFAKNNNINLRKSTGRYLMLLNDDTVVHPNSLENAICYLDTHPDVGAIGAKMLNPDGSFQVGSARRLPKLIDLMWKELGLRSRFPTSSLFANHTYGKWDHECTKEIEFTSEAGLIVRKSIIDEIGLLDERFFMFGEGADWCRRIKRAGWKIMYLPDCAITHFFGVTNKRIGSLRMHLQYYKSAYLYFKKDSQITAMIYKTMVSVIYSIKYMIFFILYILSLKTYKPFPEVFDYYGGAITLMLFKLSDPNYPFPTNE